jgi:hypothetical protein
MRIFNLKALRQVDLRIVIKVYHASFTHLTTNKGN